MRSFIIFLMLSATISVNAQQVDDYFVPSANQYLQDQTQEALETVNEGLKFFPYNKKLEELKKNRYQFDETRKNSSSVMIKEPNKKALEKFSISQGLF